MRLPLKLLLILLLFLFSSSFTRIAKASTWISDNVLGTTFLDNLNQIFVSKLYAPRFSEYGPVTVITEITNRSSQNINPKGYLVIYDTFGKVVSQTKLDEAPIYPGTIRTYNNLVGERLFIGRFKVALGSSYNDFGGLLEGSTYYYFFILPWKIICAFLLLTGIILLLLLNWKKKIVDYDQDLKRKLSADEKEIKKLKEELKKR